MRSVFRFFAHTLVLGLLVAPLAGCADMGLDIPNPFSTTTQVTDVYISQFPDVPIPSPMKSNINKTMVSTSPDGTKAGLEYFEGRVDANSLSSAMHHNLTRQGWTWRGAVSGKRSVQLFEKDQRFVIVVVTERAMNSEMETWMLNRLEGSYGMAGGAFAPSSLSSAPGTPGTPSSAPFNAAPSGTAIEQWEGGLSSQQLNQ